MQFPWRQLICWLLTIYYHFGYIMGRLINLSISRRSQGVSSLTVRFRWRPDPAIATLSGRVSVAKRQLHGTQGKAAEWRAPYCGFHIGRLSPDSQEGGSEMKQGQPRARVLIVPGLRDHVADHWQTLLAAELEQVAIVPPLTSDKLSCKARVEAIEEALAALTFLHDTNRIYWMRNVRQFLSRVRLKKKEASMIRGICRKFLWYAGKRPAAANVEETSP